MITTEEKVNIVKNYINAHKHGKCYAMYVTKKNGDYFVGDDLGPMNSNRFTPLDEYYEQIKDIQKIELDSFKYRTHIDINFEETVLTTPIKEDISLEDAEYYITYLIEQEPSIRKRIANTLRNIANEIELGFYKLNGSIVDFDGSEYFDDEFKYKEFDWEFINKNLHKLKNN